MTSLKILTLEEIIKSALEVNGQIELRSGVYLQTQESILLEQTDWDKMDHAKKYDFTTYEYWITCAHHADGYDFIDEILGRDIL